MIYTLIIFALFCIVVVYYSCKTFTWLIEESEGISNPVFEFAPIIQERIFDAVTVQRVFQYTTENDFFNSKHYFNSPYVPENIIRNSEHKAHIVKMEVRHIADEMLKQGLIEIIDTDDYYNPYFKQTVLKARVYKERL